MLRLKVQEKVKPISHVTNQHIFKWFFFFSKLGFHDNIFSVQRLQFLARVSFHVAQQMTTRYEHLPTSFTMIRPLACVSSYMHQ